MATYLVHFSAQLTYYQLPAAEQLTRQALALVSYRMWLSQTLPSLPVQAGTGPCIGVFCKGADTSGMLAKVTAYCSTSSGNQLLIEFHIDFNKDYSMLIAGVLLRVYLSFSRPLSACGIFIPPQEPRKLHHLHPNSLWPLKNSLSSW